MAFKEDFDQFLELPDFGEPFDWNGNSFNGIFDNETYRVEGGDTVVPVDVQRPSVHLKTEDTAGMQAGDRITRVDYGILYTIETFAPDGTGMTTLGLSAASSQAEREAAYRKERP